MAVLENYSKNAGDHPFFAYAYLLSWETQEIRDKLQNFNRMSGIPVKCYFFTLRPLGAQRATLCVPYPGRKG